MDGDKVQNERDESEGQRQEMVDRLKNLGLIQTALVEEAFRAIPRHLFVPQVESRTAYTDTYIVTREQDGLPISSSSQPSIMAIMLEMLDLRPGQRVLEIGAGTGYNAALMAHMVGETGQVVTIDIDEDIVQEARAHLQAAGIQNVEAVCADGSLGWSGRAPYDRIILTVATADIAPAWHEQLRPGGRLVLPLQLRPGGRLVLPLQFAPFQAKLITLPSLPDQLAFSFEWTGTVFESLDYRPCGFMRLRGNLAQEVGRTSLSVSDIGLPVLLPDSIDEQSIFQVLRGSVHNEETGVHVSAMEMTSLRLWLAMREARFCEIYVPENTDAGAIPVSAIPVLVHQDRTFARAVGLCEPQTCCFLLLQEEDGWAVDPKRPFKLGIRRFGADRALAEQLRAQVVAWDQGGRPFVWDQDLARKDIHIRAWPIETPYTPRPTESVFLRRYTRFVLSRKS